MGHQIVQWLRKSQSSISTLPDTDNNKLNLKYFLQKTFLATAVQKLNNIQGINAYIAVGQI